MLSFGANPVGLEPVTVDRHLSRNRPLQTSDNTATAISCFAWSQVSRRHPGYRAAQKLPPGALCVLGWRADSTDETESHKVVNKLTSVSDPSRLRTHMDQRRGPLLPKSTGVLGWPCDPVAINPDSGTSNLDKGGIACPGHGG